MSLTDWRSLRRDYCPLGPAAQVVPLTDHLMLRGAPAGGATCVAQAQQAAERCRNATPLLLRLPPAPSASASIVSLRTLTFMAGDRSTEHPVSRQSAPEYHSAYELRESWSPRDPGVVGPPGSDASWRAASCLSLTAEPPIEGRREAPGMDIARTVSMDMQPMMRQRCRVYMRSQRLASATVPSADMRRWFGDADAMSVTWSLRRRLSLLVSKSGALEHPDRNRSSLYKYPGRGRTMAVRQKKLLCLFILSFVSSRRVS